MSKVKYIENLHEILKPMEMHTISTSHGIFSAPTLRKVQEMAEKQKRENEESEGTYWAAYEKVMYKPSLFERIKELLNPPRKDS